LSGRPASVEALVARARRRAVPGVVRSGWDEEIAVFDGGGAGGFDMSNLLAQAQAMQNQLMEAQADLESQEIEGSAGGGLVTALVSGTGELLSLNIKKEAVDPDDTETLADLIVAAVRDASENAKEAAARAMGPLAGGLGGLGDAGAGAGFPGFGGGAPSAPAGFGLPGTTPPAVGPGDDEPTGPADEPTKPADGAAGPTGETNKPADDVVKPAGGATGPEGGVGFVNPGSGGRPGQGLG
jgi:DNA-binding YbaB/EbfC family protein